MSKKHRAIIIGSGVAGLATAVRLAITGWEVDVFEANEQVGGKLFEIRGGGYRFDAGPSLFTMPQLLDELIYESGQEPRDYLRYYAKEVACRYFWEDGTELTAWGDPHRFAAEVEQKLDSPAQKVLDYLQMSARIYRATSPVFLERSLHRWQSFLSRDTLRALSQIHRLHLWDTLHNVNSKKLIDSRLVQLFDRYATYNGSSPYLTPGVMSSIPHLEHNVGTYFPEGGMYSIIRALHQLGKNLGVRFHTGERVERIALSGKSARGVETSKASYSSQVVVSNMDVVPTYRKLMPEANAPERTLAQERSSSALIFYWGMNKQFPQLDLHNIFFSENYQKEFASIFTHQTISDDPTIYVNISSKEEVRDAPENGENWFVMVNVPGDTGQDWAQLRVQVRTQLLQKLQRIMGEDIEPFIAFEEIMDPRGIENKTASYQGSLYGASSNNTMSAFLRHPNFSPAIKDLYFCGGSVHPGGGIPLCLLSAKITASLINQKSNYGKAESL